MRFDPLQRIFLVYRGGGDPPEQTSTTTVNQLYSPEEAARRAKVMAEAQRIYTGAQSNIPNLRPAGPSGATTQAQNMMQNWAHGSGAEQVAQLEAAQKFGLGDVLYPGSNPALQATLDTATRQVGQQFTDPGGVLGNIRSNFTAGNSGGTGTRESIAGGLAARSYLDTIGDVTGKITTFQGTRFAFAMTWKVALLAEVFGGSSGFGYKMGVAYQSFRMTSLLAWVLWFLLSALFFERLVLQQLENRSLRWRPHAGGR